MNLTPEQIKYCTVGEDAAQNYDALYQLLIELKGQRELGTRQENKLNKLLRNVKKYINTNQYRVNERIETNAVKLLSWGTDVLARSMGYYSDFDSDEEDHEGDIY